MSDRDLLSAETKPKCKGFWNMCACEKCRAADLALETAPADKKRKAFYEAEEFFRAKAK